VFFKLKATLCRGGISSLHGAVTPGEIPGEINASLWLLKLYYLMLLSSLNIIVLLFEINMTVEISYNVGLIEYYFIDIASKRTNTSVPIC